MFLSSCATNLTFLHCSGNVVGMTGTGFESPAVQHVRVAELDVAYREFGEGDPAVLVHGLGGMSMNWTDLMHALQYRLHSVAIDLPGFGYSQPLERAPSITAFAQVVGDFIAAKFPGQAVHLFGNSLGGAVVVELAAMRPELVSGITLVSPALPEYIPRRTTYHMPIVAIPYVGERLFGRWLRFTPEQRAWGTVLAVYGDPSKIHPVRWQELRAETIRRDDLDHAGPTYLNSLRALLRSYLRFGRSNLWRQFAAVKAKVLVIHGRRDVLVNPRAAHDVTRQLPGSTVVVLNNAGHVAQMEFPEEVARIWRETFD